MKTYYGYMESNVLSSETNFTHEYAIVVYPIHNFMKWTKDVINEKQNKQ